MLIASCYIWFLEPGPNPLSASKLTVVTMSHAPHVEGSLQVEVAPHVEGQNVAALAAAAPARAPTYVTARLPLPPTFTGASDPKIPRGKIWWQLYAAYCTAMNWDLVGSLLFFLGGKASEWHFALTESMRNRHIPLTLTHLRTEFLAYFDPSYRDEEREAREQLHRGECTMVQYPTIRSYEQEFRLLTRTANSLSDVDQITWFIHGLSSSLKPLCIVDSNGKDWHSFDALVSYCIGAELRLLAAASTNRAPKSPVAAVVSEDHVGHNGHAPTSTPITGRLARLWTACRKSDWTFHGVPHTPATFQHCINEELCLLCQAALGTCNCKRLARGGGNAGR